MNTLWCAAAGILSGVLGAMGMGGGGVLIICLTLFMNVTQQTAQGINLIFFIPTAIIAVLIYTKKHLIKWKTAIPFALLGIAGTIAGSMISQNLDGSVLSKLFGGLLLIMGIRELFAKNSGKDNKP